MYLGDSLNFCGDWNIMPQTPNILSLFALGIFPGVSARDVTTLWKLSRPRLADRCLNLGRSRGGAVAWPRVHLRLT
jgi:hypothetical protein